MTDRDPDLRTVLLAEWDAARARVAEFDAVTQDLAAARGDSDTDDEHDPEGTTVAWDRAVSAATADAARARMESIEAALSRVDAGWDGACARCGVPIPQGRLLARPETDRCVQCAST